LLKYCKAGQNLLNKVGRSKNYCEASLIPDNIKKKLPRKFIWTNTELVKQSMI